MRVIKTFEETVWVNGPWHDGMRVAFPEHRKAVVYLHAAWGEYFVRFYLDGEPLHLATRPATSKEDAIATADFWVHKGE